MNTPARISVGRAVWLLTRLRLLRMLNMVTTYRPGKAGKSRAATPRKRATHWLLATLMGALMLFAFGNVSNEALVNLHCVLDHLPACHGGAKLTVGTPQHAVVMQHLQLTPMSTALAAGITLLMSLLWLGSVLLPLSSRELAQADWDLEWLATLPVHRGALLWARLGERTLINPGGVLGLWPPCTMLAWHAGQGQLSLLSAAAVTWVLLALAAMARTLADTGLRLWLPPSQLRNLQAVVSVLCLPVMYMALSFSMSGAPGITMHWAGIFPPWTLWTPPGLAVQALSARTMAAAAWPTAVLVLQTALLLWLGMALLQRQLRAGVVAGGSREAMARRAAPAVPATGQSGDAPDVGVPAPHPAGGWRGMLTRISMLGTTLQRRELLLLARDRNFLVQSLLVPLVIVGSQLFFNGQIDNVTQIGANQQIMAAIAFGIGSYVLMLSAFQTLNTEGQALWMLYTFPRSLESMLKEKAQLWAVLALVYPLAVFGAGVYFNPIVNWNLAWLMVVALTGVVVFALIAVSLGIFACDPLAQEVQSRIRPTYSYLYFMLCTLYVYGVYAQDWLQTVAIMVLMVLLALALWQKARDELPYLLDPAASPPARVALSDGLIAVTLFFVLQIIAGLVLAMGKPATIQQVVMGFTIAGAIVYGLVRFIYWRHKTSGVPVVWLRQEGVAAAITNALRHGLPAAAVAAAFGMAFLAMLRHTIWERGATPGSWWYVALAVVAAPLFEEFIFRGLVHAGMRRLTGPWAAALGSAAIFAIVHPPGAMLPVFVLGLCAASAHERGKSLLAPMLVHAIYNITIVTQQMTF